MVVTCVVVKCTNRHDATGKAKNISFYRFPENKKKRKAWLKAVNRDNWQPTAHSRVCSDHFVNGWHSDDPADENYAPTLFHCQTATKSDVDIEQVKVCNLK